MTDLFAPMPTVNTEEEILELEGSGVSDKINLNSSNVCTSFHENLTGSYQCSCFMYCLFSDTPRFSDSFLTDQMCH